jgi:hypothetical protein
MMRKLAFVFLIMVGLTYAQTQIGAEVFPKSPCEKAGPEGCLALALEAMGGQSRLEAAKSFAYEAVGHTALVEQSYRQDPFITSYERVKAKVDLAGSRIHLETHLTWPESDPGQAEADSTLVSSSTRCAGRPLSGSIWSISRNTSCYTLAIP